MFSSSLLEAMFKMFKQITKLFALIVEAAPHTTINHSDAHGWSENRREFSKTRINKPPRPPNECFAFACPES